MGHVIRLEVLDDGGIYMVVQELKVYWPAVNPASERHLSIRLSDLDMAVNKCGQLCFR
jgi:hypothetical protein